MTAQFHRRKWDQIKLKRNNNHPCQNIAEVLQLLQSMSNKSSQLDFIPTALLKSYMQTPSPTSFNTWLTYLSPKRPSHFSIIWIQTGIHFDSGKITILTALDMSVAFDSLDHTTCISTQTSSGYVISWIYSYIWQIAHPWLKSTHHPHPAVPAQHYIIHRVESYEGSVLYFIS